MGKQWKQWETLFSWAPQSLQMVTAAMKLKDAAPWKKSYDQPRQHIQKQRHHFVNKGPYSQSCGFSSTHYGCERWTIKKAEHWRNAFELCCWRRLLRVPWTARRSNQSILKEISPEYSLEGLMLKLKFQYCGYLMRRTDLTEKTLMLERLKVGWEEDDRGWDGWMASLTRWPWVWASSGSWWWTGKPGVLQSMGSQELDTTERFHFLFSLSCIGEGNGNPL